MPTAVRFARLAVTMPKKLWGALAESPRPGGWVKARDTASLATDKQTPCQASRHDSC